MRFILMAVLGWSIVGSSAASWRLPLPVGSNDVSGALVRMGDEVYQAKDFGLQATADGGIAISWLQGYDEEGVSIRIERTIEGASPLGFARAAVGVDGTGFLLVGGSGSIAGLAEPDYPCGLSHLSSCKARQCERCGDAPTCACQDTTGGGCDPFGRDYCDGRCGSGACNGSVNNCGCATGGGQMPAPGKAPAPKTAPQLEPTTTPQ